MTRQVHVFEPDINAGLTDLWQRSADCLRKPIEQNHIGAVLTVVMEVHADACVWRVIQG